MTWKCWSSFRTDWSVCAPTQASSKNLVQWPAGLDLGRRRNIWIAKLHLVGKKTLPTLSLSAPIKGNCLALAAKGKEKKLMQKVSELWMWLHSERHCAFSGLTMRSCCKTARTQVNTIRKQLRNGTDFGQGLWRCKTKKGRGLWLLQSQKQEGKERQILWHPNESNIQAENPSPIFSDHAPSLLFECNLCRFCFVRRAVCTSHAKPNNHCVKSDHCVEWRFL